MHDSTILGSPGSQVVWDVTLVSIFLDLLGGGRPRRKLRHALSDHRVASATQRPCATSSVRKILFHELAHAARPSCRAVALTAIRQSYDPVCLPHSRLGIIHTKRIGYVLLRGLFIPERSQG